MRVTVCLLGFELDLTLGPATEAETAAMDATTDRGYFTSQPISFSGQASEPAEWQPPDRTLPWDEPLERGR